MPGEPARRAVRVRDLRPADEPVVGRRLEEDPRPPAGVAEERLETGELHATTIRHGSDPAPGDSVQTPYTQRSARPHAIRPFGTRQGASSASIETHERQAQSLERRCARIDPDADRVLREDVDPRRLSRRPLEADVGRAAVPGRLGCGRADRAVPTPAPAGRSTAGRSATAALWPSGARRT